MSMALLNFEFHLTPHLWKDPRWPIPTFGEHELTPVQLTENVTFGSIHCFRFLLLLTLIS